MWNRSAFAVFALIAALAAPGSPSAGSEAVSGAGSVTAEQVELCFAQLADGGGYATRFLLVNPSDADVTGTLELFRSDGVPLQLTLNGSRDSSFPVAIKARGTLAFDSAGEGTQPQAGWARIRSTGSIGAALIYSCYAGGKPVAEAGVDPSVAAGSFTFSVDTRDGYQSGLAIANPGPAAVSLTLTLLDPAGNSLGKETRRLESLHHFAKLIGELFPVRDFSNFTGSVRVEASDGKVAGTTLRFDPGLNSLASLPVTPPAGPLSPILQYFPQVADGGGYRTAFSLHNPGATGASANLELFSQDGSALSLDLNGESGSSHAIAIPAGGSTVLRTAGTEPSVRVGWGRLTGSGPLGGSVRYGFAAGGRTVSEAGIDPASAAAGFAIPVDRRSGIQSGLAVSNPSDSGRLSLDLSLFDAAGARKGPMAIRTLGPRGQFALVLDELFPGTNLDGFVGSLTVKSSGGSVAGTSLRFDPGVSVLSSLPVTALADAAAAPWTGPIRIEVGQEEVVFDYRRDRCAELDLPDVYAHAVRTPDGIVLGSGNAPDNYFMFGPDFNSLKRSCRPVLRSGDRKEVEAFDPQEWITSLYSEDGATVHAIVHNEYHDPFAANCRPGVTDPSNPCWYNFLSYAVSRDGGRTFTQPESPGHLVAMLPFQWKASAVPRGAPPPHGYFEPGNIVPHEGWYYSMFFALQSNTTAGGGGTCIMRTHDPGAPGSWRLWDGRGFNIPLVNPYPNEPADPKSLLCAHVSPQKIRDLRGSLTWNTHLRQFLLIGAGVHPVGGKETCGFFLSRSADLLDWTQPQLIRETVFGWPPCARPTPEQAVRNISQEAYPSLIDHDAPDISFTRSGETGHLYFMQNMDNHSPGGWGFRRNLVRVPLRFVKE